MTISGALSNAMSGLRAAGRGAEVVSSNISNALTPGYARRTLELSSASMGNIGGVRVDGISRQVDEGLAQDKRMAAAAHGNAAARSDFLVRLENMIGSPDNQASVSARITNFEKSLINAASRPDALDRLNTVAAAAHDLADTFNQASQGIQQERSRADRSIADQVDTLNTSLKQIQALNSKITAGRIKGADITALEDQRQQVMDKISTIVPIRSMPRTDGSVALYSTGGSALIDGTPAQIEFELVNMVSPYLDVGTGGLSGIRINGNDISVDPEQSPLRGGTLMAQFTIRDDLGPNAQRDLDALARDVIERFQDSGVDATLMSTDAGLFTDASGIFDPANEVGLSSRISINANVDPSKGGESWRIRDGVNAVSPGAAGDSSLLRNLHSTLTDTRSPQSGSFMTGSYSATNLASALASDIGTKRLHAEQHLSFASVSLTEIEQRQMADGVDSDAEIQRLMVIEQIYAANARVIEAVDEMMQTMLRL